MGWNEAKGRFDEGEFLGLYREGKKLIEEGKFWEPFGGRKELWIWHAIKHLSGRLPQAMLGPFEKYYWKSDEKFGRETWWAPHNVYRQPFHAAIGALFGLPAIYFLERAGFISELLWVVPAFIFILKMYVEFENDMDGNIYKMTIKNWLDSFFWALPAILRCL